MPPRMPPGVLSVTMRDAPLLGCRAGVPEECPRGGHQPTQRLRVALRVAAVVDGVPFAVVREGGHGFGLSFWLGGFIGDCAL